MEVLSTTQPPYPFSHSRPRTDAPLRHASIIGMPAGITPLRIITTLAVVVIALFIAAFAVWWFSLPRLDEQVDTIQRQISAESYITVFLVPDTSTDISQQLQQQIEGLPGVARVAFVSADQALAKFKERLKADPGAIDALNALGGANPLGAEIA